MLQERLIEATFNQTNFWFIFFSFLWHKILVLIFNMFIYMRKLAIQNLLKYMGDTSDFYQSASKSDWYYCFLFIGLLFTCRHIPLQFKNRLWTTVVLFHCWNLIWGQTNNNYSLYLLQFLTVSVNVRLCYICFPYS